MWFVATITLRRFVLRVRTRVLLPPALTPVMTERSDRNVSIDNIGRIAKGLKVEPWRLLKYD